VKATKVQVSGNRIMRASKIYQTRGSKKEKSLVCILNGLVMSPEKCPIVLPSSVRWFFVRIMKCESVSRARRE